MQIVIDIPEEIYNSARTVNNIWNMRMAGFVCSAIANGAPLPKGNSFIAICDSDFPITEEVKQELKSTVFIGNEDCRYCFDMTEIIETDKESEGEE